MAAPTNEHDVRAAAALGMKLRFDPRPRRKHDGPGCDSGGSGTGRRHGEEDCDYHGTDTRSHGRRVPGERRDDNGQRGDGPHEVRMRRDRPMLPSDAPTLGLGDSDGLAETLYTGNYKLMKYGGNDAPSLMLKLYDNNTERSVLFVAAGKPEHAEKNFATAQAALHRIAADGLEEGE